MQGQNGGGERDKRRGQPHRRPFLYVLHRQARRSKRGEVCARLDRNVGNHPSMLARNTTRQGNKGLRTLFVLSCGTSQMTRLSSLVHSVRQPKTPGCTSHFFPPLVEVCSKTQMVRHISAVIDSVEESRATGISQRPKPSGFQSQPTNVAAFMSCTILLSCTCYVLGVRCQCSLGVF